MTYTKNELRAPGKVDDMVLYAIAWKAVFKYKRSLELVSRYKYFNEEVANDIFLKLKESPVDETKPRGVQIGYYKKCAYWFIKAVYKRTLNGKIQACKEFDSLCEELPTSGGKTTTKIDLIEDKQEQRYEAPYNDAIMERAIKYVFTEYTDRNQRIITRVLNGERYEDIAKELGVSHQTVSFICYRFSRDLLKRLYGEADLQKLDESIKSKLKERFGENALYILESVKTTRIADLARELGTQPQSLSNRILYMELFIYREIAEQIRVERGFYF